MNQFPFLPIALLATTMGTGWAQLQFENPALELSPPAAGSEVEVVYRFTNAGKSAVRVTKIETSCGCLHAAADHKAYAPGQAGVIRATYKFTPSEAAQRKTLTVRTDSRSHPAQVLTVAVKGTGPLLHMEPKMTSWKTGEEPVAKRVRFKVERAAPIRVLSAKTAKPEFSVTVHMIEEGRLYEIELQPQSTQSPVIGTVQIETDCEIPGQKRQLIFFRIEKAKGPADG